jgi:ribonucleoside-triphosphate reductase
MGYHRPVSEFNRGKKEEFYERKCFKEEKAVQRMNKDIATLLAAE